MQAATCSGARSSLTPAASSTSGHPGTGSGGHDRTGRGNIECAGTVTARTTGVHQVRTSHLDPGCKLPHHGSRSGDFINSLALHAQSHQETSDLRRRGLPGHDQAHHSLHISGTQVFAFYNAGNSGGQVHGISCL
jgi:hypothetical protein